MDETENPKGPSSENPGQASEGENQGTSPGEAKAYTEQEVQKAVSDALAKAGRDAKSLSEREATLTAREEAIKKGEAKIADFEAAQDAAEQEAAKTDPAKMRAYQAKQAEKKRGKSLDEREANLNKREQDLTRKEAESAETVRTAQQHQLDTKLYEIAAQYDINPEELKKNMAELKLTTVEQVETLAKTLSTAGGRPPEGEGEGGKKTIPVSVPTRGGGAGTLSPEQFEKLSIEEKRKYLETHK
jgi:hypothetical protein